MQYAACLNDHQRWWSEGFNSIPITLVERHFNHLFLQVSGSSSDVETKDIANGFYAISLILRLQASVRAMLALVSAHDFAGSIDMSAQLSTSSRIA